MENFVRFSIIVPVYNVEKFIKKCIISIVSQTYKDFELIIVNDGTKDDSVKIARALLQNSQVNWRIIDKANGGQGSARNVGIRAAVGEYLVFVDSDDYIDEKMLEVINSAILKTDAEMYCFNSIKVNEKGRILNRYNMCNNMIGMYSILKYPAMLLNAPAIWNKVCKRSFFNEVDCFFIEGIIYEDTFVSRALMCEAKDVVFLDEYLYYYVQRSTSTMNNSQNPKIMDILKANKEMISWFKQRDLFEKYYYELQTISVNTMLFYALDMLNMSNYQDNRQNKLVDFVVANYSGYQDNPYLTGIDKERIRLLMEYRFKDYYRIFGRIKRIKIVVKEMLLRIKQFFHS